MSDFEQLPTSSETFTPPTLSGRGGPNTIGHALREYGAKLEVRREAHALVALLLDPDGLLMYSAEHEDFSILMTKIQFHCHRLVNGPPHNDIGDVCGNCRGEWPCGCGDPVQVCGICMCSVNYGCKCDERSGYDDIP